METVDGGIFFKKVGQFFYLPVTEENQVKLHRKTYGYGANKSGVAYQ